MKIIKFTGIIEEMDFEHIRLKNTNNSNFIIVRKNELSNPYIGKFVNLIITPLKNDNNLYKVIAEKEIQIGDSANNENQDRHIKSFKTDNNTLKKYNPNRKNKLKFQTLLRHLIKTKQELKEYLQDNIHDDYTNHQFQTIKKAISIIEELIFTIRQIK